MIKTKSFALRIVVFAVFLSVLGACAHNPPVSEESGSELSAANPDVKIEHRREAFTFEAKLKQVKIVNHYGDVRFRKTDQDEVVMNAIIQRIGHPAREPHLEIDKGLDSWALHVGFADDAPNAQVDTRRGRVDLIVFVPSRVRVDVETQSGALQVSRFGGEIRARTRSGRLVASSWGRMDLETLDGEIIARQLGTTYNGTSRISSKSGPVFIGVPATGDYRLSIKAGAGIALTDAWKQGEMPTPPTGATEFFHVHGAPSQRVIDVQTSSRVQLAPVILLPIAP